MDLDIAIKYYSNLADDCRKKASPERNDYMDLKDLAAEHEQLADWLNELKILREKVRLLLGKQDRWIPVTERLPELESEVLVTDEYGEIRHADYSGWLGKAEFRTVEESMTLEDVKAWRPLPEPYTEEET